MFFTLKIRKAFLNDLSALVSLNQQYFKPNLPNHFHGFLSVSYGLDFFKAVLAKEDILVFERSDEILGYVLVNTVEETPRVKQVKETYYKLKPKSVDIPIAFGCQILVSSPLQGTGFFRKAQEVYFSYFGQKYQHLLSTFSKENIRSIAAHQKARWNFIDAHPLYFIVESQKLIFDPKLALDVLVEIDTCNYLII